MNLLKPLTTPEYFFRPRQIVHRFKRALRRAPLGEFELVMLPWGAPIRVRPEEVIGARIWSYGLFDMMVTEALCRLLDPGEVALDIGANIGQMTNLMRQRVGPHGRVCSFEPHPELFSELEYNLLHLPAPADSAAVELHNLALSEAPGEAFLEVGPVWTSNRGTAKLGGGREAATTRSVHVKVASLDQILGDDLKVGLCKIDVEGHELQVLRGGRRLLERRGVRDLVLEDHSPFPSAVHTYLLERGFTLFSLRHSLWRPRLEPASPRLQFDEDKEGKNYLATLEPGRAQQRFQCLGWRSLR